MNNADYMTNAEGHLVPTNKVKEVDRLEDDLVNDLFSTALEIQKQLSEFKETAFEEVAAFVDILAEKHGVSKGGQKGNITLTTYDGLKRIQVAVQDYIQFGPQLQIAKALIDECINEWSIGTNSSLKAIIDQAFQVDKATRVNTQAILGLRRLNITDEKWVRAMDAITESIRVTASKQYIRFYTRPSPEMDFETVTLDIAKV